MTRSTALFFAAGLILLGGAALADQASLTIDAAKPGIRTSPLLYGIFFEEINHAGDGGVYGELLRNRSFEDATTAEGWSLVEDSGQGGMSLDSQQPLNDRSPHSLRLEITDVGKSGRVGVANGGYWGVPVEKGKSYLLSLYARGGAGFAGPLTVSLEHPTGGVYASGRIERVSANWRRYALKLTATATDASARLVIAASQKGSVWLDVVSLFPEQTFKGRPNGLRPDLAGMLANMKPGFMRFPGGCYVEGDQLVNAFRWKNTIGDIAQRPGHWNLWGHRSTDGLGYHEYLQMCEDIGATPLFVINCGMAHGGNVPMDQLDEWVQDALDAIEYANGPVTSRWGALRAKNGHPLPFGLRHMEIGNENGGPAYEERYARFYKAIKSLYPEMQLVANTPVKSAPMDIVDEHYYSSPDWFASQASRYDSYDRKGTRVYVGEYACTQDCGQGNLQAALGEAAFMTGMERNSDIVVMASYAPLFVNVNNRAWNPDAICYDSASSYGTASYQVQKLFAQNRPDVVLPAAVSCPTTTPAVRGGIGLSTWLTQAEFKDIKVTHGDKPLYAADFAKGAKDWRIAKGDWKVQDGTYRQLSDGADVRTTAGDANWGDYTYSLKARKLGGQEGFLVMFHARDEGNWYWWNIGGWGNVRHAVEKSSGGAKGELGQSVPGSVEAGRWYDIRIELEGSHIRCYLDGKLIHNIEDAGVKSLSAVAGRVARTGEIVVKVVNFSGVAQDTDVALEGTPTLAAEGTAIVLAANSPTDENSFSQPTKVAPVTMPLSGIAKRFRHTFPPHSLTVLRLKPAK